MNKIYLIGDSTCQTNTKETYPQTGWGQVFNIYVKEKYEIINLAKNGSSTKSFLAEGLFKTVEENITNGDYLFIEFGHNDEHVEERKHTDPYTSYTDNLTYFINTALSKKAIPILLTPIYRRYFDESGIIKDNVHFDYPDACIKLANKLNVTLIDMCKVTKEWLISLGDEKSKEYFMNFKPNKYKNYLEGKEDNTHLRPKGAKKICELLANELAKTKYKDLIQLQKVL